MTEHQDLVKELTELEKLTPGERLKLAKKRRTQQLKKYHDSEKKIEKSHKRKTKGESIYQLKDNSIRKSPPKAGRENKVNFESSIKLIEAAARNDVSEVKDLLSQGVSPDVNTADGLTALHQCCIDNSENMLVILINSGANVNARDSELWTPLHAAATCGHLQICQQLIDRKADLLAVNADGNMPYDICEDEATLEYIETVMFNHGVTQDIIDATRLSTEKKILEDLAEFESAGFTVGQWVDRAGATLLHVAAANGYYELATSVLSKQLDLNSVDNDGWTPAHAAACWGQIPILELLAKDGADLELKTKDGKTLLDLVEDFEIKDQIEQIKKSTKLSVEMFKRANSERRKMTNRATTTLLNSMYNSNSSLNEGPFSSSVRRHSMREKHKLTVKDVKDEGIRMFSNSINTNDELPSIPASNPTSPDSTDSPPVTNIDDIEISADNVVTIQINSSPDPAPSSPVQRTVEETGDEQSAPVISKTKHTDNGDIETENSTPTFDNVDRKRQSSIPKPANRVSARIEVGNKEAETEFNDNHVVKRREEKSSPRPELKSILNDRNSVVNGNGSGNGSGDTPMHRFVDESTVVGKKKSNKCCTLM